MNTLAVTVWDKPTKEYPFVIEKTEELESLHRSLFESSPHVAAIQGYYGVGKTFFAKLYSEKHHGEYPGGIQYFSSPTKAQDYIENNLDFIQDNDQRALFIIDETTSLTYDEYSLFKFRDRYVHLINNPNTHILLIGKIVPESLICGGTRLDLAAMTAEELDQYMVGYIDDLVSLGDIWSDVIAKSHGNLRELYSLLYLLKQNEANHPNKIIHQSGILDVNGQPLKREKNHIEIDVRTINSRLISDLAQNPELLYKLTSRTFEFLIAELVEKDVYQIKVTKGTRDGGVDIYAAKKDHVGSFLFLIECKKNAQNNRVGIKVIRNLYGVLQQERATYSMVATTSFFTRNAIEFQKTIPYQMSLCDDNSLAAWLKTHK